MDHAQKKHFDERLKRISKGGANTTAQMYVGPPEEATVRRKDGAGELSNLMQSPLWVIGAILMGAVGVVLSRLARFQLTGGALAGENADLFMIVDGVFAVAIVITLRSLLRHSGASMILAKALGIVAMIGIMHALVHEAPEVFSKVFSKVWVNEVLATTQPRTILFLDGAFVASGGDAQMTSDLLADLSID